MLTRQWSKIEWSFLYKVAHIYSYKWAYYWLNKQKKSPQYIIDQTKKSIPPHWVITVYYPNKQKVSLRTLIIKQTKIIFPSLINHFLLPITEKLIIFGWGWGKVACQGFYHLGGGEQKVSQKQPAKVSQKHTAKSESESYCKSVPETACKNIPLIA